MRPVELPNGVIIWPAMRLTAKLPPEALGGSTGNGRGQRERITAIVADLERLSEGWVPGEAELAGAPILSPWRMTWPDGTALPWLIGTVAGHPSIPDGRTVETSLLVALDGQTLLWGRTVSRFYRLGRPVDAELSS